jgi:hypothetical protein
VFGEPRTIKTCPENSQPICHSAVIGRKILRQPARRTGLNQEIQADRPHVRHRPAVCSQAKAG